MIRVLIIKNCFNEHRIALVRRVCPLELRSRYMKRAFEILDTDLQVEVYEGLITCEAATVQKKLNFIAVRLTDNPEIVKQVDDDMDTYLIDDGDLAFDIGGG